MARYPLCIVSKTNGKTFLSDGQRICPASETLEKIVPLMPEFGITRLANITGLDRIGLPVYTAIRPLSRGLTNSQGKGMSHEQAKVSALMESIESWHAERVLLPQLYESSHELLRNGFNIASIDKCPMRRGFVTDESHLILWVEGLDLFANEKIWVPWDLVTLNFVSADNYTPQFLKTSNGLASGNSLEEAILHGIYEVIERDAITLWSLGPDKYKANRAIAIEDLPISGELQELIFKLKENNIIIAAWDITSDIDIPAFAVVIYDYPPSPEQMNGMCSGYGCHMNLQIALQKAVLEAIQSRLTLIAGARDDLFPGEYLKCLNVDEIENFHSNLESPCHVKKYDWIDLNPISYGQNIQILLERLKKIGLRQCICCDLSRKEYGIYVARIVIPGLEGTHFSVDYSCGDRMRRLLSGHE